MNEQSQREARDLRERMREQVERARDPSARRLYERWIADLDAQLRCGPPQEGNLAH